MNVSKHFLRVPDRSMSIFCRLWPFYDQKWSFNVTETLDVSETIAKSSSRYVHVPKNNESLYKSSLVAIGIRQKTVKYRFCIWYHIRRILVHFVFISILRF